MSIDVPIVVAVKAVDSYARTILTSEKIVTFCRRGVEEAGQLLSAKLCWNLSPEIPCQL